MKKISISNSTTGRSWGASFESQTELDTWLAKHVAKNTFGLPERPELDAEGNPTGVILPAEYSIVIEDISAQLEQEAINSEALAYLASTDWVVVRASERGEPVPEDIKAAREAARARIIR